MDDATRVDSHGEPISGLCFDDLHDQCEWPTAPSFPLYCSCSCHERKARAMTSTTDTEPEPSAAEAQEIEAAAETWVTVPLAGYNGDTQEVRCHPPTRWRASAIRALNQGQFDVFMSLVLHEDDYDTYVELDPTAEEIGQLAEVAGRLQGEALGKSGGRRRSSRSTRKR
ncbi:hypothetical protein [Wenjunlia vitaminophila]|uniref:hypothetical protein n=1 Tax=Wenjunlia vitaminophila TaxID=76728 RepID=UPI00037F8AA1|nr:hypothetical protein [Wenjunlia vitaminophila]